MGMTREVLLFAVGKGCFHNKYKKTLLGLSTRKNAPRASLHVENS